MSLKKEKKLINLVIEKFESITPTDGFGSSTRVYISKQSNKVFRFIENIGMFSSAWSIYPESFSKYQTFSWFVNQTSDLLVFIEASFFSSLNSFSRFFLFFYSSTKRCIFCRKSFTIL